MRLFTRLRSTIASLVGRSALGSQIDEELRFHLEARTADLIAQGLSPKEATRQARLELGSANTHRDEVHRAVGLRWFDDLIGDLRYAIRILRKDLAFTVIAAGSLALAIGANTTIFSFANQLLFVSLSVPHPEQLHVFRLTGDDHLAIHGFWGNDGYVSNGQVHSGLFPYPSYLQLRKQNHVVDDIFAFAQLVDVDITAAGKPEVGKVELISGNFYAQMQVKPQLGRVIEPTDDSAPGAGAVAVISDGFWHREFGGAQDVIGKTIRVNLIPVTIIGVNPPKFKSPVDAETSAPEVFLPFSMTFALVPVSEGIHPFLDPNNATVQMMARVEPGVSVHSAEIELDAAFNAVFRGTAIVNKGETVPRLSMEDGSRGIISGVRPLLQPLYVLLGLSGLVLLLACANIANLMLARASFRQREISVRLALGASRSRILRQVLTESLLVAVMGGAGGLFLGYISRNLIPWLMHTGWDGGEMTIGFDWRVFGFTCAVTLLTGIVFGIVPAWRSTGTDVNTALKDGIQTSTQSRKVWSGKTIVSFQIALSTLLIVLAIFFLRTLFNLYSINPGFQTQDLLLVDITPARADPHTLQTSTLHSRIADAFATVPGVQEVTYINHPLAQNSPWISMFLIEGVQRDTSDPYRKIGRKENVTTMVSLVGPHFFSTMSIPILAGRGFSSQDTKSSTPVAVINQALVRQFFPNTNPIGKRFFRGLSDKPGRLIEIIGICADIQYNNMRQSPPAVHFDLDPQAPASNTMTYIVRSKLRPADLVPSLRRSLRQIDPDLPLNHIRTQQQQIDASMQQERMFASLTVGFGILALALACVGIYGIMTYTVTQRTNEIGIRLALGAQRGRVRSMVLRESVWLTVAGIAAGLAAALLLGRLIKSMLYGVGPNDPVSLTGAGFLLLTIAVTAAWIPAARASRIEPMEALRHD